MVSRSEKKKQRESDVVDVRKMLRKIWGEDKEYRPKTYKETLKLRRELGMNKNFDKIVDKESLLYEQPKIYNRICKYCNKVYKIERFPGEPKPTTSKVCSRCKEINRIKAVKKRLRDNIPKIEKRKEQWENKLLSCLGKKPKKLSQISKLLNLSEFSTRAHLKSLLKKNKIKITLLDRYNHRGPSKRLYSLS